MPARSYNHNAQRVTASGEFKVDASTIKPEAQLTSNGLQGWSVSLGHRLSDQDRLEAKFKSDNALQPTLSYTRQQDGVELTLSAPVSSDISANASVSVKRTFEL